MSESLVDAGCCAPDPAGTTSVVARSRKRLMLLARQWEGHPECASRSADPPSNEGRCAAALLTKCGRGRRASLLCATERAARGCYLEGAVGTNDWLARVGLFEIQYAKKRLESTSRLGRSTLSSQTDWLETAMPTARAYSSKQPKRKLNTDASTQILRERLVGLALVSVQLGHSLLR